MNVEVPRDRLIFWGRAGYRRRQDVLPQGPTTKLWCFYLPRTYRANKEAERKYTCRGPPPEAGPSDFRLGVH